MSVEEHDHWYSVAVIELQVVTAGCSRSLEQCNREIENRHWK